LIFMGKEQACPFSLRAEIIGIADSVRQGKVSLTRRLKGTFDNLRSAKNENQNQLAYSTWEYQEGVDRKGRPDLVHPRFGSMTDSLLRFVALQSSPEGRKMAKFQLRQWLLIKEAALELKDGEMIYALIPRLIEIEDGAALMRLKKDGNCFLAQSRLLPPGFDQKKAKLLFKRFEKKGLVIKSLSEDEPSPIFQIAKKEKERMISLKDNLAPILFEPFQSVLTQAVQESQALNSWVELPELAPLSFFDSVFPKEVDVYQPALEKAAGAVVQEVVIFAPSLIIPSAAAQSFLPNLPPLQREVESTAVEEGEVEENKPVREDEKVFVKEEQVVDMERQKGVIERATQPIRKATNPEVCLDVHPEGVKSTRREAVVVFEAAEPVIETTTEPFAFISERCRFLESTEGREQPILFVPNNIKEVEQIVFIQGENSLDLVLRTVSIKDKDLLAPHREMIKERVSEKKVSGEGAESKEKGVILSKVEVRIPKEEVLPEGLKSLRLREIKPSEWHELQWPSWIELLSPKEMGIVAALARDKFGINQPFSFSKMADSVLFWLLGTSLFAPRPTLYKLELDLTPLVVRVREGKYIVASWTTAEEVLGIETLFVGKRQFFSHPLLFLTT
jgi:hypothetical protein